MTPTKLLLKSIFSPKVALSYVVNEKFELRTVAEAAIFVSVINTLLTHIFNLATYSTNHGTDNLLIPYIDLVLNKPLLLSIIELTKIFFITSILTYGGRLFSGSGSFLNTLQGVVWVHFVLIFINAVLFLTIQLSVPLAGYLIILTNFWIMWALAECAVRVHGFKSTFLVFIIGILFFMFIVALFIQFVDALGINLLERAGLNA